MAVYGSGKYGYIVTWNNRDKTSDTFKFETKEKRDKKFELEKRTAGRATLSIHKKDF